MKSKFVILQVNGGLYTTTVAHKKLQVERMAAKGAINNLTTVYEVINEYRVIDKKLKVVRK